MQVTDELGTAYQKQLQINREAPVSCKFNEGDRVICDLPLFDGVGTVIACWYVPSNICPHWRVKVEVMGGTYRTWEAEETTFKHAIKFDGVFDYGSLLFQDHTAYTPPGHIPISWAFHAKQKKRGYEPWHGKKLRLGDACGGLRQRTILSMSLCKDGIYYLNFPEGEMKVMSEPIEIKTEDGYILQLSVDQQYYICSGLLLFVASDIIFNGPDSGWLQYEGGVEFHVTIPAITPEDEAAFLASRLPGQIIVDENYCWLKDDQLLYEAYNFDVSVEDVRNAGDSCTLPDGRKFVVLTWVPGLSPIESLLKE